MDIRIVAVHEMPGGMRAEWSDGIERLQGPAMDRIGQLYLMCKLAMDNADRTRTWITAILMYLDELALQERKKEREEETV